MIKILSTEIEVIDYQEPIEYYKTKISASKSILYTGEGQKDLAKFSLIGHNPVATFKLSPQGSKLQTAIDNTSLNFEPWKVLRDLITQLNFEKYEFPINRCGVCGYWNYDLNHTLETLPSTTNCNYSIPHALYAVFSDFIYFDELSRKAWKIHIEYNMKCIESNHIAQPDYYTIGKIKPDFSKEEYCSKVNQVRDYIYSGDVYEVNLSQQFSAPFNGNPFNCFYDLYRKNPAPFSAYMNFSDFQILSLSPEQFIKAEANYIETRPIKGTAARYIDPIKDNESKERLLNSEKDKAELHMIVDLLRNDLSKNCQVGSVEVVTPHRLEKYTNVWHLVAIVKGELQDDEDYIELIKGAFPGGSITGCPKVRSMEIIDELENSRRNLYTGSIFVMNKDFLQSSIVIRTGIVAKSLTDDCTKLFFNSGGAVTIDSNPESEYDEIIQKVTHFISSGKESK